LHAFLLGFEVPEKAAAGGDEEQAGFPREGLWGFSVSDLPARGD